MSERKTYTRLFKCPPYHVDEIHSLLKTIWVDRPKVMDVDRFSFDTAMIELTSNMVRHGDAGSGISCLITINVTDDEIQAILLDTGKTLEINLEEAVMPDGLRESGRGISIIKALVDTMSYTRDGDLNKWQLSRKFTLNRETTRQAALDSLKIIDTPPEERFDRITRLAQQLFGVETAAITFIDHDRQWFKSKIGLEPEQTPRKVAFCDVTIRESKNLTIVDASQDSRFNNNPLVIGDPHIRFYSGYPLETSNGERVGALCIFDPKPRIFTEADELQLRELALWAEREMNVQFELNLAAQVQKAFIPKQPEETFGFDVAGGCVQARTVGGDFYDWFPVAEGGDLILADVMGKGTAGAIVAASVRAVLRAGSANDDMVSRIRSAATQIEGDLITLENFVTLFLARLNVVSGLIRYVDAGHGLTIVIPLHGEVKRLKSNNPPLGLGVEIMWEDASFVLNHGDTMICVSDGVLGLFDGTLRALDSVAEIARGCSTAQEIVDKIFIRAGVNAEDDVTVLVLRRNLSE